MTRSRFTLAGLLLATALWYAAGCGSDDSGSPPTLPDLGLDTVATGLSHPLLVTAPPNDLTRLFIVERTGRILIIKNGVLLGTPFLDLTDSVSSGAEQGVLGLAFAPDYATSRMFVVHYVDPDLNVVLARFHAASASADVADPDSEEDLLTVPQPVGDHNGGTVAFGADDHLYMSLGDGGCCGDPDGHGQDRTELLGSILRLDVSGAGAYAIPPTNPYAAHATFRHELWSYGLRNPWRFSFDRTTGDIYIGDVGDNTREEVNVVSHSSNGGENYGWRVMEGSECFGGGACNQVGLTLPVVDYGHPEGCSVIGGNVYRGPAIPALRGTYFYADFCAAWIRTFRWVGGAATDQREYTLLTDDEFPNSFGEDGRGELYITTELGNVYRIVGR